MNVPEKIACGMEIPIILQMVAILFCWKLTAKKNRLKTIQKAT